MSDIKLNYRVEIKVPGEGLDVSIVILTRDEYESLRAEIAKEREEAERLNKDLALSLGHLSDEKARRKRAESEAERLRYALRVCDEAFSGIYGGDAEEALPIETMTADRKAACNLAVEAIGALRDEGLLYRQEGANG